MRFFSVLMLLIILFVTPACGGNTSNKPPAPPEIHYGEDVCEFCGMITSEERFAAGYLSSDGEEHIFDDIGDMVQAQLESKQEITALFVHDYEDHTWIKAETAHYTRSNNLPTPMLSGLVAFTTAEKAQALAAELDGEVLTYDELLARYQ